jgi:two-component system chemotaxis sensor kinase CheA
VEVQRLDRIVALTENLLSPKLAAGVNARRARDLVERLSAFRSRAATMSELRAIEDHARALLVSLRTEDKALRTGVDELHDEIRRARMMPGSSILEGFPLMVRDLCRETGKEVVWETFGTTLEIDRKVLELVKDPLIHLVRNAIDHGIETPDARLSAGKSRAGRVTVTFAPSEANRVSIVVADDGAGFALPALREAAARSRIASASRIAALTDADVTELAYSSGISTSPVVTMISGHGRGLAIVRERVERVEGRVSTDSRAGVGTVIRIDVPASIAAYRALLVAAGNDRFLFPMDSVERTFALPHGAAAAALGQGLFQDGDAALPFAHVGSVLGVPFRGPEPNDHRGRLLPCIVIRSGERRGVLLVDDVLGDDEVVLKDFRPPLRRVRNVLASALLGTGQLVLLLRPLDVLLSMQNRTGEAPAKSVVELPAAQQLRILVVDDSITTRTMERNLFEAAGYAVRVAPDGIEAWNILQTTPIDLVVSDVDMPHMDGFELTSRIRAEARLAELPVVLVTALEDRADKERGIRVGANAYVLKSGFNQVNLLEIVRRLA